MTETQKQVVKWLATGRVGMSSTCMAMWLGFGEHTPERFCPADPDDLDRCLKLLHMAPGLRPLIPKMADVSEQWARLVPRWDEVEASHLAEVGLGWTKARSAPKTYDLMASILRPERVRACLKDHLSGLGDYPVVNYDHPPHEPTKPPHRWAHIIKAWADGYTIEARSRSMGLDKEWNYSGWVEQKVPGWYDSGITEYRVKPPAESTVKEKGNEPQRSLDPMIAKHQEWRDCWGKVTSRPFTSRESDFAQLIESRILSTLEEKK